MLAARSMRLATPLTLLLASRVLFSSVSAAPSRTISMAATASGAVSGTSDAPSVKDLVEDVTGFKEPTFTKERTIGTDVESKWQGEGVGARVRRSIGRAELRNLDPFLMLDEFSVGKPAGFPDHPHRGFETVTYMLKGTFMHEDFKGHRGIIGPGDLQWMTAGKGIMHSEVPMSDEKAHGLQLWVNLAAKNKMVEPKYQELLASDIPKRRFGGVVANIIAGSAFGTQSPVYTITPTMYIDFAMEGGSTLKQPIPAGWNGFVYVLEGSGRFGGHAGEAHHTLVLSNDGSEEGLTVTTKEGVPCRFALIAGEPLNEPIVQHGPFVMNTREEIMQTMMDFQSGKNGFEGAAEWSSEGSKSFH